jgi:hypothetical protein
VDVDLSANQGRPVRQGKQPMNALCRSTGVMGTARGEGSVRNSGDPHWERVAPSTSLEVTVHAGVGEVRSTGEARESEWREGTSLLGAPWEREDQELA